MAISKVTAIICLSALGLEARKLFDLFLGVLVGPQITDAFAQLRHGLSTLVRQDEDLIVYFPDGLPRRGLWNRNGWVLAQLWVIEF